MSFVFELKIPAEKRKMKQKVRAKIFGEWVWKPGIISRKDYKKVTGRSWIVFDHQKWLEVKAYLDNKFSTKPNRFKAYVLADEPKKEEKVDGFGEEGVVAGPVENDSKNESELDVEQPEIEEEE